MKDQILETANELIKRKSAQFTKLERIKQADNLNLVFKSDDFSIYCSIVGENYYAQTNSDLLLYKIQK